MDEAPRVVALPCGDQAALDYACDLVRQLKKAGGYDDPGLVVLVRDERGRLTFCVQPARTLPTSGQLVQASQDKCLPPIGMLNAIQLQVRQTT